MSIKMLLTLLLVVMDSGGKEAFSAAVFAVSEFSYVCAFVLFTVQ